MPCTQFEALVARRQAWHDWGKDSDKSTIQDEDEDKDGDNDSQEDAVPLEARIRQTTVLSKSFSLDKGQQKPSMTTRW
jgi:hypothetical protein